MSQANISDEIFHRLQQRAISQGCSVDELLERFLNASLSPDLSSQIPYQPNETMLSDFTNNLPGMILMYRLKPDGRDEVPFVSASIIEIYEVSADEALADISKVWAKVHPNDLPRFAQTIRESAENLTFWEYEWRIRMNDGSIKWVSGLGTPRRLEDGSTLWNTLIIDITERKTLQQQQKEVLDQLQLSIVTANLGIWQLDLKSDQLEWNDQMFDIFGTLRENFSKKIENFRNAIHPDDIAYVDERFQAIAIEDYMFDVNFRIVRPNGDIRYINGSAHGIRDELNQVIAFMGINIDVTHIRQGEIKLQQTNEMLQSLIEHIPVLIALFDENRRFRFVNQYWIDSLGWTLEELNAQADSFTLLYPNTPYRQQLTEYIFSDQHGWRDLRTRTKRNQIIDVSWVTVRLFDGQHILIGQDITERKRVEQIEREKDRLLASLKSEKEHSDTVQRIVAKLVHDVKTPLSIISISREILSNYFDRINVNQRRERLETIAKQLKYVTELLNDLTHIKDPTVDSRELDLFPTNLAIMCQITIHDIQESIGVQHKLTFINNQTVDVALIDNVLINRILLNLLSNAVKYSPANSEIQLRLSNYDEWLVLEVRDQGIGITQQDLAHIFDPFYRVNPDDEIEGTGLGLSIVKDCVERHNGYISVESSLGEGTNFMVRLPLIVPAIYKQPA